MRKKVETRSYKQGPLTLKALKTCGFREKIDRSGALVNAACSIWLSKKGLAVNSWRLNKW